MTQPAQPDEYDVTIERKALKELAAIEPRTQRGAIVAAIMALGLDPRPSGCTKLSDTPGFRIRIGSYRVVYLIDDGIRVVTVTKVGTRGSVYKK
ncbi:type II toxin-antitoxin system RelE family toxin [Nocardia acidivorans]|uniref:type II toxin-antitoxin system RelE family toxin n=1 Tax=Nocardia acidivorans TaxID=404580 RepID=UPI0008329A33|nr:type II toxin-antitoxin system RelE/ParE family toxin [Nocardia acidivorans]